MSELYAFPDHEVIRSLVPGCEGKALPAARAARRIGANPGIVPLAIDPRGTGRIYFADIGDHCFREWQYMYSIRHLATSGGLKDPFTAPLEVLDCLDDEEISPPPAGFIFHVSRCGSTLIGKALARSRHNIVINQGGPLQRGFWAAVTNDFRQPAEPTDRNLRRLRAIVALMTRRRWPEARRAFVKMISWNSLYLEFVRAAWPTVPKLFLYRAPVEVIASVLRDTTAVLENKDHRQAAFLTGRPIEAVRGMDRVAYLAACYANYFKTMLDGAGGDLSFVNYKHIGPSTYYDILKLALNLEPDDADYRQMLEQFRFHSKDDSDKSAFRGDSSQKRSEISTPDHELIGGACDLLVRRLDNADQNLFKQQQGSFKQQQGPFNQQQGKMPAASVEAVRHGIMT